MLKILNYKIQVQKKISEMDLHMISKCSFMAINNLYDFNSKKAISFNDISNKIII